MIFYFMKWNKVDFKEVYYFIIKEINIWNKVGIIKRFFKGLGVNVLKIVVWMKVIFWFMF